MFTCPACGSQDLIWYAGEPGVHISLNGRNSGECNTCGSPFAIEEE